MPARFLLALTLTCIAILGGIAAVNFTIDANGAYGGDTSSRRLFSVNYVEALLSSPHGLNHIPLERPIKLELAKRSNAACYILGSSHEVSINLRTLPALQDICPSLVNLGVSGGVFEDAVAFLSLLSDKPSGTHVFVSIPPWFFRPYMEAHWTQVEAQYVAARNQFNLDTQKSWPSSFSPSLSLINADYFLHNLGTMSFHTAKAGDKITPAHSGEPQGKEAFTLPDGSYRRRNVTPEPEHLIGNGGYKLTNRVTVIPGLVNDFQTVLTQVKQRGIRITLLLTPYHPKVFDCQPAWICTSLRETETATRNLAHRLDLPVLWGYSPVPFGLTHPDFEDDHHVAPRSLWKLGMKQSNGSVHLD